MELVSHASEKAKFLYCNHFLQCRTVKIAILGEEGVPVQVDGEAWIQPPGYIWIVHKNRAQTLTRDRVRAALDALYSTLMGSDVTCSCSVSVATHESLSWWMQEVRLSGKNMVKLAFTTWEII